ncbi:iron-containing alcohol dehydrogenase [Geodermatophilus sp. YIM 151500]|uniref:iron-containing alcohol dehydrogenase n=1 Tax=Geodermatophilus sp. YIM 151500 TaxID=2984531 RepID=UPI0021E46068|nr:iron-containing alcohol dehydrogenase [Geodermatophilus sp. YIM 151500]MCV2488190.1 iron-containing alcohol dehydrogenase [Geodermatophilus sp. YIM 151500]
MGAHSHFVFELPTRIEFGSGSLAHLGQRVTDLGGTRVLVVTDEVLAAIGMADRVTSVLDDAKIEHVLFTAVEPEPDAAGVQAGAELLAGEGCDLVVAIGGGSVLDTGKAISLMSRNPGHIRDYAGLGVDSREGVPIIAVPTTAGTGSEATIWAVISEKASRTKYGVGGPHMTADLALLDPDLSVTLPPRLTAVTGLDALAHALESYVNKATQPFSEAMSEKSMELVAQSLRDAVWKGDDPAARADMLMASTLAAAAFNSTRLGLAHALAMPLGARAKIPHGDVVSILLPEVMRFNVVGNLAKFARIARIFGEPVDGLSLRAAADAGVAAVERLVTDVAAPRQLGDYGVTEADLPELAEAAMKSGAGNIVVNPRATTSADLVGIMRRSL